jgi:hypothetical protein
MGAGRKGWIVAAATTGAVAAAPAAARGAELFVAPCSAALPATKTIPVRGTGFAPNQVVQLAADGQSFGSATTDATGTFQDTFFGPSLSSPRRMLQTFQLTGTDPAGGTATVPLQVTRVSATLPDRARPASRVRMRVYGFQPGRTVYLHVRRSGKTRGTFKIARAASPCGTASRRLRYMPLRRWSTGTYTYEFQQSPRFRADQPRVQLRIAIVRTVRRG